MCREIDRFRRGVRTTTGDDRNPPGRLIDADLDDPLVFLVAERRALSGRSNRNETMGALLDLPVDEFSNAASSTAPSLNGVIKATRDPLNIGLPNA